VTSLPPRVNYNARIARAILDAAGVFFGPWWFTLRGAVMVWALVGDIRMG